VGNNGCDDQEQESDDVRENPEGNGPCHVSDACGAYGPADGKAAQPQASRTPPAAQPARETRSNDDRAAGGQDEDPEAQLDNRHRREVETHDPTVLPLFLRLTAYQLPRTLSESRRMTSSV